MHIFRYSDRPGTASSSYVPKVSEKEKSGRCAALAALREGTGSRFRRSFLGRELEIVVEKTSGTASNYIRVELAAGHGLPYAGLAKVRITRTGEDMTVYGTPSGER